MFISMLADAAAQTAQEASKQPQGSPLMSFMPIIIIMVVFMFFMSRSQKKQQQKRQEMIDHIVKGTKVLLTSGIRGVIDEVKENDFIVEIAPGVRICVVKSGVAEVEVEEAKAEEKK